MVEFGRAAQPGGAYRRRLGESGPPGATEQGPSLLSLIERISNAFPSWLDENKPMNPNFRETFKQFRKTFFQPNVFIYICLGSAVMFFTFFTDNNALEIAISGFASVFIGIGVNNFTFLDVRKDDERQIRSKVAHSLRVLEMTEAKIAIAEKNLADGSYQQAMQDFVEVKQVMQLLRDLIKEEEILY